MKHVKLFGVSVKTVRMMKSPQHRNRNFQKLGLNFKSWTVTLLTKLQMLIILGVQTAPVKYAKCSEAARKDLQVGDFIISYSFQD